MLTAKISKHIFTIAYCRYTQLNVWFIRRHLINNYLYFNSLQLASSVAGQQLRPTTLNFMLMAVKLGGTQHCPT